MGWLGVRGGLPSVLAPPVMGLSTVLTVRFSLLGVLLKEKARPTYTEDTSKLGTEPNCKLVKRITITSTQYVS